MRFIAKARSSSDAESKRKYQLGATNCGRFARSVFRPISKSFRFKVS